MEKTEAKALLGTLLAAFRPRDFGEPSEQLYLQMLSDFEFADAKEAVESLIRSTDYMPTIHALIEEIDDWMELRTRYARPVLPPPDWTDEDEAKAKALAEEFYGTHVFESPVERRWDATGKPLLIPVDEAEVAAKREAVARAKAKLLEEQEAE